MRMRVRRIGGNRPTLVLRAAASLSALALAGCAPGPPPAAAMPATLTDTLGALSAETPARSDATPILRVVAYNIKHGRGMDDVVDLVRIADVLRGLNADVIALQEVDDRTERTGGVDQAGVLAELLGYRGVHGPHRPYQGGHYGNAVLTRLPIRSTTTHPIPPASGSALAVLEVEVATEAGPVSVVSVHLAGSLDERMAQARLLDELFTDGDHPVVLAGDFNGRPDDAVVQALGRRWSILPKSGARFTYPADEPDREIDFVMIPPDGQLRPVRHVVTHEPLASDHRPLVADLLFHPPPSTP
ncbi:MAG: hypothetical protein HKN46_09880 [Acidimicrobiia bacterium]|nr:hypothetical protein [Acidimicrobiia bacterium]